MLGIQSEYCLYMKDVSGVSRQDSVAQPWRRRRGALCTALDYAECCWGKPTPHTAKPAFGRGKLTRSEVVRVQKYLRDTFGTDRLTLAGPSAKDGSVEVNIGNEFIGIIYRDEEDGDVSYAFHMAIMEMDLPRVAGIPSD